MGHAQMKESRIYIPIRDKNEKAKPAPAQGNNCDHSGQVHHAFLLGFARHHKAMEDLSKV